MNDIEQLNEQFGVDQQIRFYSGNGRLPTVEMVNRFGKTAVSIYAGHVLSYQPHDQEPVLWVSQLAQYSEGKAIRGGIPVIWPWFGAHPTDDTKSSHGLARRMAWEVVGTQASGDSRILRLSLTDNADTRAIWPYPFQLTLTVILDHTLTVDLAMANTGNTPFTITQALHSYFTISDVTQIAIHGLDQTAYLDQLDNMQRKRQSGPITIDEEVDRIYVDTTADCVIEDATLGRRIRIAKQGSGSTVVWNPWIAKAARMGDFGDEEYQGMVCIETTNAADDKVTILPGDGHRITAVISAEPLN
ncbi:MAG: D-hexose-6-phosphate mutarotase [Chloroflexota bacterium]